MSSLLNLRFFALLLSVLILIFAGQPVSAQEDQEPNEGFCALYPLTVSQEFLDGAVVGTYFEEVDTGTGSGNFSWLTWSGDPSAPTLALSLVAPGNSRDYVNPDDDSDSLLEIGDWVQGHTGVTGSRQVKDGLNALLGEDIIIPIWVQTRDQGNNFDYLVQQFAVIRLEAYQLSGQGWISFSFQGYTHCYNQPPVAQSFAANTLEDTAVAIDLLATDADGDVLTYQVVDFPTHGVLSGTGSAVVFTPNADYHGEDLFTYHANDGSEDSNLATVTITISAVNDAPVAFNQQIVGDEDAVLPITLTAMDKEGDSLTYTLLNQPTNGELSGTPPDLVFAPDANFNGEDQFTFIVNDGEFDSNVATITIVSNPVNDAPVADDQNVETLEDDAVSIALVASDVDGDSLVFSVLIAPQNGVLSGVDASLVYTPNPGYFGLDSFQFIANDGQLDSNLATVNITVAEKPKPPEITSEPIVSKFERESYEYQVIAVDPNAGDVLSYSLTDFPAGMTINNLSGYIDWAPPANLVNGLQSVNPYCSVSLFGAVNRSVESIVLVDQSAEVATDIAWLTEWLPEWQTDLLVNGMGIEPYNNQFGLAGFDTAFNPLTVGSGLLGTTAESITAMTGLINSGVDQSDGYKAIQAALVQYSMASPVVHNLLLISDSARAVVDITVDRATLSSALAAQGISLDVVVSAEFICGDDSAALGMDANGFAYKEDGVGGVLVCEDGRATNGLDSTLSDYVDLSLESGGTAWNIQALRAGGLTSQSAVTAMSLAKTLGAVDQLSINQADLLVHAIEVDIADPTIVVVTVGNRGLENATSEIVVRLIDGFSDSAFELGTVVIGSLDAGVSQRLRFDLPQAAEQYPQLSADISDLGSELECLIDNNSLTATTLRAQATDPTGLSDNQTFAINVYEVNDAPNILTNATTIASISVIYDYQVVASDPDLGDAWRYSLQESPLGMSINPQTGQISWSPTVADTGAHSVNVVVTDIGGLTDQQSYTLNVAEQNGPPEIVSMPATIITAGQNYFYDVNAVDPDGDDLVYELLLSPIGALIDSANGVVSWPTNVTDVGQNEFSVLVTDVVGQTDLQDFIVTVITPAGNQPPVAYNQDLSTEENLAIDITLTGNDPEGDPLVYLIMDLPTNGSLSGSGPSITYLPNSFFEGYDTFTFVTNDNEFTSTLATVTIDVNGRNNPPQIISIPITEHVLSPRTIGGLEPINLDDWIRVDLGYPGSPFPQGIDWVVSEDGTSVVQRLNGWGATFQSPSDLSDTQIDGNFKVLTTSDDDYIGFIFGYQNRYQYYLFDWKRSTQSFNGTTAYRGMGVKKFNLAPDGSQGVPDIWTTYNSNFDLLYHNDIGWNSLTDYSFSLTYLPGEFTITVSYAGSSTILATTTIQDDTFTSGKFGFYNFSQGLVEYKGFSQQALASRVYNYNLLAIDPDGDDIFMELLSGPADATFDSVTGILSWTTTSDDIGSYTFTFRVTDEFGLTDTQTYVLNVIDEVPLITSQPHTSAFVDVAYAYDVAAIDPNPDDDLSFSLLESPAGMSIAASSGLVEWLPVNTDLGDHNVRVRVTDLSGNFTEQNYVVTVLDAVVNEPPFFVSTPPSSAFVGRQWSYTADAIDPEGGLVTFSLVDVPAGMQSFGGASVYWVPTADQVSTYPVVIVAVDQSGAETRQEFIVTVTGAGTNGNDSPQITSSPGLLAIAGNVYEYQVFANDIDGDSLQFSLDYGPLGMSIDAQSGLLQWQPSEGLVGYFDVIVRASDGVGGFDTQSYTLAVSNSATNSAPIITSSPPTAAFIGQRFEYHVLVNDADGDALTFSLTESPLDMSIDPLTGLMRWIPTAGMSSPASVAVRVADGRGGSSEQSFVLSVEAANLNSPPLITSLPVVNAAIASQYQYQVLAADVDNDPISYTLIQNPTGMSINATGLIDWTPASDQSEIQMVAVEVNDGEGGSALQSFEIVVDAAGINQSPLLTSLPSTVVAAGELYSYQVEASDNETLSYGLLNGPLAMVIDAAGLISWQTGTADVGSHVIDIEVSDGIGGSVQQSYALQVTNSGANQVPQLTSTPLFTAKVGNEYRYQILATDGDGDVLSYAIDQGPSGMTVSSSGYVTWTPDTPGDLAIVVQVSDGIATVSQGFTLTVLDSSVVLDALVQIDPDVVDEGNPITITVLPTGAAGNVTVQLTVDGIDRPLDANLQSVFVPIGVGSHSVSVRVNDPFDSIVVNSSFFVRDPNDSNPPTVLFENVTDNQEITAPIDLLGTVSDANLSSWTLYFYGRGEHNGQSTILAQGSTVLDNQSIDTFDPTLLTNGLYTLVLSAVDQSGNFGFDSRLVRVTGDLKVGNFTITFEDLSIPVSGIPITVNRTYDSRRKREALDFGYGWSIDYQNVSLQESRKPGFGWELTETRSGFMGAFVTFCIIPSGDILVTITLPDGSVEQFEAYADPECNLFQPLIDVDLKFRPVDGNTLSTLEPLEHNFGRLINGSIAPLDAFETPINPDRYRLTTKAGFVYVIDQQHGIETVSDPNGNTLTYTDDGIFHSDGKSVLFNRDASGRITDIVDPNNNIYTYDYDGAGDLIAATDPTDAEVSYNYNFSHGLLEIIDPLGQRIVRNIYDDDGRLIAQEDNEGNRTEFNHDIDGRTSVITDRLGRNSIFSYDDEGNVLSQIDPAGGETSFTYDLDGNQLSQTNPLGHTTFATFNGRRDQLTQTDALGNTVEFTYNQFGQELTVVDARDNTYINTYDPFGNLLGVEDPLGNIAGQNINAKGLVSLRRDAESNETTFTYDGDGNVLTQTDPLGNVTTNTWDDNGNKLSESRTRTLADSTVVTETTSFEFDERNRLTKTTDALGNSTETEYDLLGRDVASIDALGRRTEMEYDVFGRLTTTTYPDMTTETRTYDKEGNLLTETDRRGRVTKHVYDLLDRETETIFPDDTPADDSDNPRTFTEYDAAGRVTANIDANGNRTEYGYDNAGRRTSTTDALNHVTTFSYDADGNLISTTDARGNTTTNSYDELSRRTLTTFEDNSTKSTEYDDLARVTAEIDQNGIRTEYDYDKLGRLITVTDALLNDTSFSYDEVGNKLTQTDAEIRTTEWQYDALGRAVARILPLGQVEVMSYNEVGNRSAMSDFNGNATTYSYDVMDQLTRADYHDGSFKTHTYNDLGQRTQTTHRYGTESWAYDERSRLASHTDINGNTLTYDYDAQGNRTAVTGPSGTTSYTFDALNRLKTVSDGSSYQYDQVGNTAKVVFANGTETAYVYDDLNRLTQVDHATSASGTLFDQQVYTLMPSGHRTSIAEFSGRVVDYFYDDLYRLTSEQTIDTLLGNRTTTFTYDIVGNRQSRNDDGVITSYTYDLNDRMTAETTAGVTTTYSFDDQGNTLSKSDGSNSSSFAYDPNHRTLRADDGVNPIMFEYDAAGIRQGRTDNAGTINYVVDSNRDYAQVIEEQDAFGVTDVTYTYGLDLLSQQRAGSSSYYHYDGLGSTRTLTDGAGNVTDSYVYKAFGTVEAHNGLTDNDYLFAGEQFDDGLAQYYLRARYYDPNQGRFTQMDTFAGVNRNPVTLHKYLYANASPANFVDPSGRFGLAEFGAAVRVSISLVLARVQVGASLAAFNIFRYGTPLLYGLNHYSARISAAYQWATPIRLATSEFTAGILRVVRVHPSVLRLHAGQMFERYLNPIMRFLGGTPQQNILRGAARPDWIFRGKHIVDAKLGQHISFNQLANFVRFAAEKSGSITYVTLTRVPPILQEKVLLEATKQNVPVTFISFLP